MATPRFGFSLLLMVLVLSLLCLPAAAAPDETPLGPNEIGIRQAHLSWVALTRDMEMNAAITYIYPLFETNTTRLNSLYGDFKTEEALIPGTTTRAGFDNLTQEMRSTTAAFRNETEIQMTIGQGKWDDLTLQVRAATTGNPYIEGKAAAYWSVRKANQLSDFDAWLLDAQGSLDLLGRQGYDTAAAQRTHDVIASKRPDLASALDSKSNDQIAAVNLVILGLSQQLGSQVAEIQMGVSGTEKTRFYIDQGYRAVYVADTINNNLTEILLDIGPAEPALKKVKVDLAATDKLLSAGNLALSKTPLLFVKTDLRDLAGTYRDILNTADLPPDLSETLRALIITLDNTSDQMDVSL
jgi:hypothetical protein